ncbi:hypothetical protein [uncultured Campylobacter sp.]|uniref:hypothetical protein n=1 Tax=uncultured Campylobacter sp. TaxID=218934 RepID=UPI00262F717E|nr:hypothetical protein [uncultured Campylobacter sp.]
MACTAQTNSERVLTRLRLCQNSASSVKFYLCKRPWHGLNFKLCASINAGKFYLCAWLHRSFASAGVFILSHARSSTAGVNGFKIKFASAMYFTTLADISSGAST